MKSQSDCDALAVKPDFVDTILDLCASKNKLFLCDKHPKKLRMKEEHMTELVPEAGTYKAATNWEEFES